MKQIKIVAFGDSLTAGSALSGGETNWTEMLSERFSAEIVNSGIGGNTTDEGLMRMERDVFSFSPDIVIINFGMNDHVICDETGTPKTQPDVFCKNLRVMIERCLKKGIHPVLVTPNRIIEEYYYERHPREWYLPVNGAQAQLAGYCESIRNIAKEYGVPLADIHRRCEKYSLPDLLRTPCHGNFRDGVHPYGAGIDLYADTIAEVLASEVIPKLSDNAFQK